MFKNIWRWIISVIVLIQIILIIVISSDLRNYENALATTMSIVFELNRDYLERLEKH